MASTTTNPFVRSYRKKPVEIEAAKLTAGFDNPDRLDQWDAVASWVNDNGGAAIIVGSNSGLMFYIDTLEGRMTAYPGDYIIRGVKGEFYPCKPDIFDQTYEAVYG